MKKIILNSLVLLSLLGGCKKALDVDSTRVVSERNDWNSLEDARAHLFGAYGLTRAAMADHNAHWLYGDVRSGDFTSPTRQDLKAIINNNLSASYASVEALSNWRRWYAVVNQCNVFLERIREINQADPRYIESTMTVDIAQIRFLRAFAYFYMCRIWGDVPLISSSMEGKFENKARDPQAKVLQFVKSELQLATEDLPYQYGTREDQYQTGLYYGQGLNAYRGVLATKNSAQAILAHAAAWDGDYETVATATQFVMRNYSRSGSGFISLDDLTDPNGLFYRSPRIADDNNTGGGNNPGGGNTQGGARGDVLVGFHFTFDELESSFSGHLEELTLASPFVSYKSVPDIYVTKDTIKSIFNEGDDFRFSLDTVGRPTPGIPDGRYFSNYSGRYPIFTKVKVVESGLNPNTKTSTLPTYSSSIVFTRLEDIVLLRAEALASLGEVDEAANLLNEIRIRRYDRLFYKPYDPDLHGTIIDAIFQERRKELIGEGHRWYDLVRYQKFKKQANSRVYQLIKSGGIYWPISKVVLQQNSLITQNSYWK